MNTLFAIYLVVCALPGVCALILAARGLYLLTRKEPMKAPKSEREKVDEFVEEFCAPPSHRERIVESSVNEFRLIFIKRQPDGFIYELVDGDALEEWVTARLRQAYDAGVNDTLHPASVISPSLDGTNRK